MDLPVNPPRSAAGNRQQDEGAAVNTQGLSWQVFLGVDGPMRSLPRNVMMNMRKGVQARCEDANDTANVRVPEPTGRGAPPQIHDPGEKAGCVAGTPAQRETSTGKSSR